MSEDSPDGSAASFQYPAGVERVLLKAATDPAFLVELREHRAEAAQRAGLALTASERAVLGAISDEQLEAAIGLLAARGIDAQHAAQLPELTAGIRPGAYVSHGLRPDHDVTRGSRAGLPIAIATGAIVVGGAGAMLYITAGSQPDMPPETTPALQGGSDAAARDKRAAAGAAEDAGSDADRSPQTAADAGAADAGDEDAGGGGRSR